jgi:hypothetical protein
MSPRDNSSNESGPDPRNQPNGANDQDKHGRKQNSGSNLNTHRKLGSDRDPKSSGQRDELVRRDIGPRSG